MQIRVTIVIAVCILAAVASVAALAVTSRGSSAREELTKAHLASLEADLAGFTGRLEEVASRLKAVEAASREARTQAPADLEREVERVCAKLLEARSAQVEKANAKLVEATDEVTDADAAIAMIVDPTVPRDEKQRIWKKVLAEKWWDPVLAALEARARKEPSNADFQSQLGAACIQKLTSGASDQEKAALAAKADKAFDAALKVDPSHWEARFLKATSLSYWPPIFGKQPDAIREFETLRLQQEGSPQRPEFAQTYLFLGNLYAGQGQKEKASETFRRGLELFPADKALAQKAAPVE